MAQHAHICGTCTQTWKCETDDCTFTVCIDNPGIHDEKPFDAVKDDSLTAKAFQSTKTSPTEKVT